MLAIAATYDCFYLTAESGLVTETTRLPKPKLFIIYIDHKPLESKGYILNTHCILASSRVIRSYKVFNIYWLNKSRVGT